MDLSAGLGVYYISNYSEPLISYDSIKKRDYYYGRNYTREG